MARKSHTCKQGCTNATAAKHDELRNGPAQTQAFPGQYIRCARNGTVYKPDLLLLVNTTLTTAIPMAAQKSVYVFEGDRFYTRIGKQQKNASFAKEFFLGSCQRPELSQPVHLPPAADRHRAEPRGRIVSDLCKRRNQHHSSRSDQKLDQKSFWGAQSRPKSLGRPARDHSSVRW